MIKDKTTAPEGDVYKLESFEILYENCDCISVDPKAIKALQFVYGDMSVYLDSYRMEINENMEVDHVYIRLDTSNPEDYTMKNETLNESPLDRVLNGNDITRIYVNGIRYNVPYVPKAERSANSKEMTQDMFDNKYETIEKSNRNESQIVIRITSGESERYGA